MARDWEGGFATNSLQREAYGESLFSLAVACANVQRSLESVHKVFEALRGQIRRDVIHGTPVDDLAQLHVHVGGEKLLEEDAVLLQTRAM